MKYLNLAGHAETVQQDCPTPGFELYGDLPLGNVPGKIEAFRRVGQDYYDFMQGKQLMERLEEGFYASDDGATGIIELRSPSRLLHVEGNFSRKPAEDLADAFGGSYAFLSLEELREFSPGEAAHAAAGDGSEHNHSENDPGEYLSFTFPGGSMPGVLSDDRLLECIRAFADCLVGRMLGKIEETSLRLQQLYNPSWLRREISLDYLDIHNLPRDFIMLHPPQSIERTARLYWLDRKEGRIGAVYELQARGSRVSATLIPFSAEEAHDARTAIEAGGIFYLRDCSGHLLKNFLGGRS